MPLGKARIARAGDDLTIVTWSAMVHEAAKAAELAAARRHRGRADRPADPVALGPGDGLDASVTKTGRLLVAHEAVQVGGFGAEIAATVAEELRGRLRAPVRRLGAPRIPIGYAPSLEDQVRVTAERDHSACHTS